LWKISLTRWKYWFYSEKCSSVVHTSCWGRSFSFFPKQDLCCWLTVIFLSLFTGWLTMTNLGTKYRFLVIVGFNCVVTSMFAQMSDYYSMSRPVFFLFIYSHVHTLFGSFLPPALTFSPLLTCRICSVLFSSSIEE
jgi:hypothetical protein